MYCCVFTMQLLCVESLNDILLASLSPVWTDEAEKQDSKSNHKIYNVITTHMESDPILQQTAYGLRAWEIKATSLNYDITEL